MTTLNTTLLAGALILAAGVGTARAADILPVDMPPIYSEAPELVPVEVGNGWYLRGDVGYDFESETRRNHSINLPLTSQEYDGNDITIDDGYGFSVGAGYQFTDFLRGDVTGRYAKADVGGELQNLAYCVWAEPCDASDDAEMTRWEVMANAYVDLGTISGFTPYVGAGAGAVQVDYENATINYCDNQLFGHGVGCASINAEGEKDWRFAYSLMAGVSYDVSSALKLDVGYRFLDVDGGGAYRIGSPLLDGVNMGLNTEDDGFKLHTVQAGLRYSLF
ncbi:outer membrane protein [Antarcticirhabdus aurantiaca]|uniref:Porin family protein n=1 Tax=Antarcticirhabdus aurantiaca TaxID=2606717 RepID=A0ACD4NJM5_9HYPH|nr:outer membrane protein [Antarcticirhabdus aurantiaca]WAJ27063.1 porin family protein [Jeongeuplla avenae]